MALRPRIGLAFALAVPIFPLGNVALGLALVAGEAAGSQTARQDVSIPMDDGVSIAATLYLPDGSRTEVPILHLEVVAARKEAAVRHSYLGRFIGQGIAPSGVNG
jgi:predicted acyl esterase